MFRWRRVGSPQGGEIAHRKVLFTVRVQRAMCCNIARHSATVRGFLCPTRVPIRKKQNYSADVAIFQKGVVESIVEVHASHATTDHALESRFSYVGVNSVWEVSAMEILKQQVELITTDNTAVVRSLLNHEPAGCKRKKCPGCDAYHTSVENRACRACSREWDEWNEEWRFVIGGN